MPQPRRTKVLFGSFAALGCETLYGLSYLFTKQATTVASPWALLGWRFLVAWLALSALILIGVVHINLKGKKLKSLLVVALFNPVLYFIQFATARKISLTMRQADS